MGGIIQIFGSVVRRENGNKYDTGYMLLELCGGSLFDEVKSNRWEEGQVASILLSLVRIVRRIHERGFTHLDLKPENILLYRNSYKVCDFGSALLQPINLKSLKKK